MHGGGLQVWDCQPQHCAKSSDLTLIFQVIHGGGLQVWDCQPQDCEKALPPGAPVSQGTFN